jgi:DNA polymerase-1
VDSWFKYTDENNRVHGKVITNGAVTGRMTHSSPNLAQIPASGKPYGKECRQCWTVPTGSKLVGIDASGLELRMLAHYMDDDAYTAEVLDGDIHTANMNAAGLTERSQAKTFIYAFLYGAGAGKIGSIVGGSYVQGQELIDAFLDNTPALKELKAKVARLSRAGILQGLDGRQLRVRSEHSALNTLLQGAGAIVMKQALINLNESLTRGGIPFKLVANVHDEWQIETPEYFAPFVGRAGVKAIEKAGIDLELRCPLTGEYNIGDDWSETH